MTERKMNWKDFLIQSETLEGWKTENNEKSITKNLQARERFFNKDLASLLGQGPIRNIPKKHNKEKIESITPEMEAEIKKVCWENYDKIIF